MALRHSLNSFKSMARHLKGNSATYTTATSPKTASYTPTADLHHHQQQTKKGGVKGDFVPVYVAIGMIAISVSLGLFTAKHQILYSPNVRVKKKVRETVPEVEDPDRVVDEADKFLKKSLFRKIAHIQEFENVSAICLILFMEMRLLISLMLRLSSPSEWILKLTDCFSLST
ncbi:uncharacterized protein [Euphorbia lathyris]|uniref:uncharacterized protein n=1 Tax=Euphorbia lathyris TaxID=212925 RepID=UPI003313C132